MFCVNSPMALLSGIHDRNFWKEHWSQASGSFPRLPFRGYRLYLPCGTGSRKWIKKEQRKLSCAERPLRPDPELKWRYLLFHFHHNPVTSFLLGEFCLLCKHQKIRSTLFGNPTINLYCYKLKKNPSSTFSIVFSAPSTW